MKLSSSEKCWLPWFGKTGNLWQRLERNQEATVAAHQVLAAIQEILMSLRRQMDDIDTAMQTTAEIRAAMELAVDNARQQFGLVQQRTQGIRASIEQSSHTIKRLGSSTEEIGHMIGTVQSQARDAVHIMESGSVGMEEALRLAEAAASDNTGMTEIVERMFSLIQSIADSSHRYGNDVQGVAESMRSALDQLNFSVARARQTSLRLQHLSSQFQVTQLQARPAV